MIAVGSSKSLENMQTRLLVEEMETNEDYIAGLLHDVNPHFAAQCTATRDIQKLIVRLFRKNEELEKRLEVIERG